MNLFTLVTEISLILNLLEKLPEILFSNFSNGKSCPFFLVCFFGNEIQRGSHPLTWYSHIILWLWRCYFSLVHTIKLIRDVQDNVLLAILDLTVFLNIAPSTSCHVHRCELIFSERFPSGSIMINIWWWCYNC